MRTRPILAGLAAGAVLAAGGIAAIDAVTDTADAQSRSQFATKSDVKIASGQAQAAINLGKRVWNLLGVYEANPGELVGKNSGPIRQQRGVGGGIPEAALREDVRQKLNAGGPQGAQGPQGPAGARGPVGPTEGVAVTNLTPSTFPTPDATLPPQGLSITTTEAGRLHLTVQFAGQLDCGGDPFGRMWLRLNQANIESSLAPLMAVSGQNTFSLTGITDQVVPAGSQSVDVAVACTSGSVATWTTNNSASASAIVLG